MHILSEALWMAAILVVVAVAPAMLSSRVLRPILTVCRKLSKRALLVAFAAGLLASAALNVRGYLPQPAIHDDFSNLLAADTFASGRLTNPAHELWRHFESMHIIQQPTYMSKYPPGNALMQGAGQALTGKPIVGVWISLGLAAAAIGWMLRAWLPPYWALLGAVIAAFRFSPTWGQMYTGGAMAACGGALMIGATRRLIATPKPKYAAIAAVGAAILANTRPYEGLVAAAVCAIFYFRSRPNMRRLVAPALAVLLPAAAWMGYYNYRVTGDPLQMPYKVHDATYAANPLFLWQPDLDELPEYEHSLMRDYYEGWERPRYLRKREFLGFNASLVTKIYRFSRFFIGPTLLIPVFLALLWRRRESGLALPAWATGAVLLALTQALYLHPLYAAPITGAMILFAVQGIRYLRLWKPAGLPYGAGLAAGIVAMCLLHAIVPLAQTLIGPGRAPTARTKIVEQLEQEGGKHLVVVSYPEGHSSHEEWVYNHADIDQAAIVWARSIDPPSDEELLVYFAGRRFWRLSLPKARIVELSLQTAAAGEEANGPDAARNTTRPIMASP